MPVRSGLIAILPITMHICGANFSSAVLPPGWKRNAGWPPK